MSKELIARSAQILEIRRHGEDRTFVGRRVVASWVGSRGIGQSDSLEGERDVRFTCGAVRCVPSLLDRWFDDKRTLPGPAATTADSVCCFYRALGSDVSAVRIHDSAAALPPAVCSIPHTSSGSRHVRRQ